MLEISTDYYLVKKSELGLVKEPVQEVFYLQIIPKINHEQYNQRALVTFCCYHNSFKPNNG
jgi:hypothetical protein